MPLIRVDPSALQTLANSIGNVAPDLSTAYLPDTAESQSWGVASTLDEFGRTLQDQRLVLQEQLQAIADSVLQTANDFYEYDAALTADFNRILPENP